MVPSGFKQCLIRRYESFLGVTTPMSTQNGTARHPSWDIEIFEALVPGNLGVVVNLLDGEEPIWQAVNTSSRRNGVDTLSHDSPTSGERVGLINDRGVQGTPYHPHS